MNLFAPQVDRWLADGLPTATATVVETWGSAPRRAGAKLAVTDGLAVVGSVSGGCVESAVIGELLDALADRRPRLLTFGVSDESAWEVGLACGGTITVYGEALDPAWWRIVRAHEATGCTIVTVIAGEQAGAKLLIAGEQVESVGVTPGETLFTTLYQAARAARSTGRGAQAGRDLLVEVITPPPTLLLIGGAHVAAALADLGHGLGFRVVVIDPRSAFATPERFPAAQLIHAYPDAALAALPLDPRHTYAAILSHDPKIDDPALRALLPLQLPYVGVMSSRATHAERVARLTAAGVAAESLATLRTPIGLAIGARSPEEIALAIMAEIVAVRNGI